jgi:hypothetical protein
MIYRTMSCRLSHIIWHLAAAPGVGGSLAARAARRCNGVLVQWCIGLMVFWITPETPRLPPGQPARVDVPGPAALLAQQLLAR